MSKNCKTNLHFETKFCFQVNVRRHNFSTFIILQSWNFIFLKCLNYNQRCWQILQGRKWLFIQRKTFKRTKAKPHLKDRKKYIKISSQTFLSFPNFDLHHSSFLLCFHNCEFVSMKDFFHFCMLEYKAWLLHFFEVLSLQAKNPGN